MPLPQNIPTNIEGLSTPRLIDEAEYREAESQAGVSDWRGLIEWSPDMPIATYDAYSEITNKFNVEYNKYGAVILALNGGAHNAPVIGWLGMNVFDELKNSQVIVPISVLISRDEEGAPFSYGAKFLPQLTTLHHFARQRFFATKMRGFLV